MSIEDLVSGVALETGNGVAVAPPEDARVLAGFAFEVVRRTYIDGQDGEDTAPSTLAPPPRGREWSVGLLGAGGEACAFDARADAVFVFLREISLNFRPLPVR